MISSIRMIQRKSNQCWCISNYKFIFILSFNIVYQTSLFKYWIFGLNELLQFCNFFGQHMFNDISGYKHTLTLILLTREQFLICHHWCKVIVLLFRQLVFSFLTHGVCGKTYTESLYFIFNSLVYLDNSRKK